MKDKGTKISTPCPVK